MAGAYGGMEQEGDLQIMPGYDQRVGGQPMGLEGHIWGHLHGREMDGRPTTLPRKLLGASGKIVCCQIPYRGHSVLLCTPEDELCLAVCYINRLGVQELSGLAKDFWHFFLE